jgi:hypothetical protein
MTKKGGERSFADPRANDKVAPDSGRSDAYG